MSWDYSDLSHTAKEGGGPEKYIKDLEAFNYDSGREDGKAEQAILDLVVAGVAVGGYTLYKFIRNRIKKADNPKNTEEDAEHAREELIHDIKNADTLGKEGEETSEESIINEEVSKNGEAT